MARWGTFRRFGPPWLALAGAALAPHAAFADAVPPPPWLCPPGKVGVTSHRGPECVDKAPDCPPGWVGQLGGTCALRLCSNDSSCDEGHVCVEEAVCLEPYLDEFYDYYLDRDEMKEGEADPPPAESRYLLAGPPPMRHRRPSPIYRYRAVNLCSTSLACAAPNTCQRERLCVPKGQRASAYAGTNVHPVTVARKTQTPLTISEAQPDRNTALAKAVGRGCAGCAQPGSSDAGAGAAAAVALAVAAIRRRARARDDAPKAAG